MAARRLAYPSGAPRLSAGQRRYFCADSCGQMVHSPRAQPIIALRRASTAARACLALLLPALGTFALRCRKAAQPFSANVRVRKRVYMALPTDTQGVSDPARACPSRQHR